MAALLKDFWDYLKGLLNELERLYEHGPVRSEPASINQYHENICHKVNS